MMNAKPLRLFLCFGIVLIPVVCSAGDAISFSTLVSNAMDAMRQGARLNCASTSVMLSFFMDGPAGRGRRRLLPVPVGIIGDVEIRRRYCCAAPLQ